MVVHKLHRYLFTSALIVLALLVPSVSSGILPASARPNAYPWSRTLSQGMRGPDVAELQIRIAGWAADGIAQTYVAVDGAFGPGTAAALRRFQAAYGLVPDGVAGPVTQQVLNSLEKPDGSTIHFNWGEFSCRGCDGFNGGKVGATEVRENIRRLMYKLEALRKKVGNRPMTIVSGFRSIVYNANLRPHPGATDSQHLYGDAADVSISGMNCLAAAPFAGSSGFSGIEYCAMMGGGPIHVDSRREHPSYGSGGGRWWWPSRWNANPRNWWNP